MSKSDTALKTTMAMPSAIPMASWKNASSHFANALDDPWYHLIFRLSGDISFATNDYFRQRGFLPALAPVTAQSITSPMGLGSDSLPVSVNLFDRETFLVDSMQFHLEYLLRQGHEGLFYIMPTFRGEDPDARHLNEFFHIEAEIKGGFEDNLRTMEELISYYTTSILGKHSDQIAAFTDTVDHIETFSTLVNTPKGLPRISFREAEKLLGNKDHYYNTLDDLRIGLTPHAEQVIMKEFGCPVWLTHLPSMGVPFYQADAEEPGFSLCADLLMGIGEVAGSGQRHLTYEQTMQAIHVRSVDPTPYEWYLRMKREYPVQTSGFGIGLERLLLWILKHHDIRDTQLIVRQKGAVNIP